ncbi:hypothetical protein [uncultured Methanobrevibacter sp.]|uniref:hypothetical protein n=1 Tax=uncultured Methanobrevibacter sp. TaxID=253161 RepID=UPI00320B33DE
MMKVNFFGEFIYAILSESNSARSKATIRVVTSPWPEARIDGVFAFALVVLGRVQKCTFQNTINVIS